MKRNHSRAWRGKLCAALPMAMVLLAGPAWAVRVLDVRVGQHGEFTRIVFDLDGPARYRLEPGAPGAPAPELVVHFDATAQPKTVRTLSKIVAGVRLEARPEGAVARIALRSPNIHTVEETLSSPPRVVIDLRASTPAEATSAKPPVAAPPPSAEPPAPVAAPAAPPPATAPTPRTTAEVIEAQADAAAARLLDGQGAPKPGQSPGASGGSPAPPEPATGGAAEGAPAATEPAAPPHAPSPAEASLPPRETGNPPGALGAPPPPPAFSSPPWGEPWRFVTGAVLIVLGVFVWFLIRRREPAQGAHAEALPADTFLDRMSAFGDGAEREAEVPHADTEERTEALPLFSAVAASARSVEVPVSERSGSGHEDSLFGGAAADTHGSDAEPLRPRAVLAEPAESAKPAASPHTEESGARTLRDLEQRLAQLEQRLARDADARERLERQVVAQTEELRVQRAAIARTQRVLRTLSRPEDLATEPVIKSPGPSSGSPD
jgi:hypothetical protein